MNAEQKKRIAHEISNWKNACNCRAVQLTCDRMAALLQELTDAPEPVPVAWLPGGFRIEHFAKDDPILTDEANAERRFFVTRIEPPYHKDGVWFGATAEDALAKACAAIGVDYANAPPTPIVPDGWRDAGRLDFITEGAWHVQWEKKRGNPKRYRMIHDGEPWGKWHKSARAAIDAAIERQGGE